MQRDLEVRCRKLKGTIGEILAILKQMAQDEKEAENASRNI